MKGNISFVIIAYNEEKRIANVVKNFINYGEVVILDGGSTDKTQEIAESLGAKWYKRPPSTKIQIETQENFEFLKSKISHDWVYFGHSDYYVPKTLIEKMVEVSHQEKHKILLMPLYTYLWGVTSSPAVEAYTQMFFHKDYYDFTGDRIHFQGRFTGDKSEILHLPNRLSYAIRHFSTYNEHKFVTGYLRYTEFEAEEKFAKGERFSLIKMIAAIVRYGWIYRKSMRVWPLGVIIVLNHMFSRLMVYSKVYELQHGITLESIEDSYTKEREKMLATFSK